MSKKLLFNFNREVIQNYTYVKYAGTIITATNTLEKPIKSAILSGNTKRIPAGKNIFDKTSKLYDGWLYANGNYCEEIGGKFYTTDFIEVKPNTDIVVNNGSGYAQYDDNKKSICNVAYGSTTTLSNTKYIRVVVKKEAIDTLQIEYGTVSTNYEEPIFELQSVKMPVLTTSNEDGTKTNILTVNEDVTLRSNGDVCDELNLLTGRLTQRIDENNEVLAQEVVKTVDLSILDQNENKVSSISSFNDTTHIAASSETIPPIFEGYLATKEVE